MTRVILIITLLTSSVCSAQEPIFVGVMAGQEYGQVLNIFSKSLKPDSRLGIFSLNVFEFYWDNPSDYLGRAQYHLTYTIGESFQIGTGLNVIPKLNPRPSASITFIKSMKSGTLLLQANSDLWGNPTFGLFGFYEFSPKNDNKVNFYFRLQCVTDRTTQGNTRSYQFVFTGISVGKLRFGPAVEFNQFGYGANYSFVPNYGGFFNYLIF